MGSVPTTREELRGPAGQLLTEGEWAESGPAQSQGFLLPARQAPREAKGSVSVPPHWFPFSGQTGPLLLRPACCLRR